MSSVLTSCGMLVFYSWSMLELWQSPHRKLIGTVTFVLTASIMTVFIGIGAVEVLREMPMFRYSTPRAHLWTQITRRTLSSLLSVHWIRRLRQSSRYTFTLCVLRTSNRSLLRHSTALRRHVRRGSHYLQRTPAAISRQLAGCEENST